MSLLGIVQSYKYSSQHNSKANRSYLDTSYHLLLIFLISNFWVKLPTHYLGWVEPGYCFLKKSPNKNFKRSKHGNYWHFMLSSSSILQPETENTEISNRTVCTWTSPNYEVHMILGLRKVKGKVSEMSVQERHRSGSYFSTIHFSGKTDSVTEISSCPRKR